MAELFAAKRTKFNCLITGILALAVIVTGCRNRDQKIYAGFPIDYIAYTLSGNEEDGVISCRMEYFASGPGQPAVGLTEPSRFKLDDSLPVKDSTQFAGVFYEILKPLSMFAGTHKLVFIDSLQKEHVQTIHFAPVTLRNEIPDNIHRKPFDIMVSSYLPENAVLRLVLTDTSFQTEDVNDIVPVRDGKITVTRQMLNRLANGPIDLELFMEENQRIDGMPRGQLMVSYSLHREFSLTN